jgi:hypothetical protein
MTQLLCRNRVRDFNHWHRIFTANLPAARAAGLVLAQLWQQTEDPNNAFFLFEVEDLARAQAFLHAPEAAAKGAESGVIDGEYHFLANVLS